MNVQQQETLITWSKYFGNLLKRYLILPSSIKRINVFSKNKNVFKYSEMQWWHNAKIRFCIHGLGCFMLCLWFFRRLVMWSVPSSPLSGFEHGFESRVSYGCKNCQSVRTVLSQTPSKCPIIKWLTICTCCDQASARPPTGKCSQEGASRLLESFCEASIRTVRSLIAFSLLQSDLAPFSYFIQ